VDFIRIGVGKGVPVGGSVVKIVPLQKYPGRAPPTCFKIGSVENRKNALFSRIPSVGRLLETPYASRLRREFSHGFAADLIGAYVERIRREIARGQLDNKQVDDRFSNFEKELKRFLRERLSPSLRTVINATGVIIYTNAGRSPLRYEILRDAADLAARYTNLEYDLDVGKRGHRDLHIESRILRILDCEAATVCNNAAAALLLILNTLALGKEVLVSRGELIEIGGSFRLPAIMEKSGAILREVGTTNKTKPADYSEAVDDRTALILRVHPSNYRVVGFTQRPDLEDLVRISKSAGIPLVHDIGSGYLFPTEHLFLRNEPVVEDSLRVGSDLVCFSGDKLLGGPQAGLILGRRELVGRIRKNPLMRAMRVGKITYSVLERTLVEYEQGTFERNLPIWRMINLSTEEIRIRAERILGRIDRKDFESELMDGFSLTGGGSAPEEQIPTCLISMTSNRFTPNQLEQHLRRFNPPILSRIEEDRLLLDLRTVFPEQDETVVQALQSEIAPT